MKPPGSLMAGLRQRRLAGDVALNWLYQDRHLGWLALVFASDRPEEVDRQITHWLQALQQTTPEQQQHYYQLSRRRFQALSPSISCASGHSALPRRAARRVRRFLCRPQAALSVSLACQTVSQGSLFATQAFSLPLAAGAAALSLTRRWRSLFIRRVRHDPLPNARRKPRRCSTSHHRELPRLLLATALLLARPIRPKDWRVGNSRAHCFSAAPAPCRGHGEWHLPSTAAGS